MTFPSPSSVLLRQGQRFIRILLALALVLSSLALPQQFLPRVFAGDNDSPLQTRLLGACDDPGLGIAHVGVGLDALTGATFDTTGLIPAGSTIVEAWLYWNGADIGNAPEDDPNIFNSGFNDGDPTVTLNATQVVAPTRIGGPAFFATSDFSYAYRADISSIVNTSTTSYVLAGVDNLDVFNNGAELVIVYRNPARGPYFVAFGEGLDMAKGPSEPASGPGTKAVIWQFDPAKVARTADISVFLGGAGVATPEVTALWYLSGNDAKLATLAPITDTTIIGVSGASSLANPFDGLNNQNSNGFWDDTGASVAIPAGATFLAVQVESNTYAGADTRHQWIGALAEMPLACPTYTVTKTRTTPDFIQAGQPVSFDILVTNTGNTDISTSTLTDTYDPIYLTYNAGGTSPLPNTTTPLGTLIWNNIGPIPYNTSKTVTVAFTAAASTQDTGVAGVERTINDGAISNVVDQNGITAPDDDDTDNVAITDPGVTITKTLITPVDGSTTIGGAIQYKIAVSNTGDTNLVTVPVTDTFENTYLTFANSSPSPSSNTPAGALTTLAWNNVGPIAVGNTVNITVNFTAAASTQGQPSDQTINHAATNGVVDENGDSPPDDQSQAPVEIGDPGVRS